MPYILRPKKPWKGLNSANAKRGKEKPKEPAEKRKDLQQQNVRYSLTRIWGTGYVCEGWKKRLKKKKNWLQRRNWMTGKEKESDVHGNAGLQKKTASLDWGERRGSMELHRLRGQQTELEKRGKQPLEKTNSKESGNKGPKRADTEKKKTPKKGKVVLGKYA